MNIFFLYDAIALVASFLCGMFTIPVVLDFCRERGFYDMPNARKVHKNAIPRLGGVVFVPSMFIGVLIVMLIHQMNGEETISFSLWTLYFLIGMLVIYVTGLIDDISGVKASTKLLIQMLATAVLPAAGLYVNNMHGFLGVYEVPFWVGTILTIMFIAFICNAINMIDGIDGLCTGLVLIALTGFFFAYHSWSLKFYEILIASLIGVLLSYLFYSLFGSEKKNRKIFMGDTGSLSLGFLLGFLCLKLSMVSENAPSFDGNGLLISFSLLIVPNFDVFRVAFVRMRHHRSPMAPDKNHIHHKLMRGGCSQHQALAIILLVAVGFVGINMLADSCGMGITAIIAMDIVVYVLLHQLLDWRLRRKGEKAELFEEA